MSFNFAFGLYWRSTRRRGEGLRLHYLGSDSLNAHLADLRHADSFTSDRILHVSATGGSVKKASFFVQVAVLFDFATAAAAAANSPGFPLCKNTRGRERYRNHTDGHQDTESHWGNRARR